MEWLTVRFGFSYVGLLFLLLLMIPNLLWAKNKPEGYDPGGENRLLLALERAGQVLVSAMSLCFAQLNLRPWTAWSGWLALALLLMAVYECFWARYFRGGHTLEDFYGSFWGVPVAGATLPILAFLCLGLYGKTLWFLLAVMILGVGHIGVHLQHRNALFSGENR